LAFLDHNLVVKGQQSNIHTVFLTLKDGIPFETYILTLKDSIGNTKDQISITPDSSTMILYYSPPPGITINVDDKICSNTCIGISLPDSFGTSSVTISLSHD
jgi:hypothetical protein